MSPTEILRCRLPLQSVSSQRARVLGILLLGGVSLTGAGCRSVSFYTQAVRGQWHLLTHQRPIAEIVADPKSPPEQRAKLDLVQRLREFAARELDLPAKNHYTSYVDLHRPYVVWTVHAAPEFSLEPKQWWYPIVGRLEYRGYFDEKQAQAEAHRLEANGFETCVNGADAYSTLGWFRDPVLNTFLDRDEADLADLVFHELTHQRVFLRGDTDFNEALATAVAEEGVRRWFRHEGNLSALEAYERQLQDTTEWVRRVAQARDELETLYKETIRRLANVSLVEREAVLNQARKAKQARLDQLRADLAPLKVRWGGTAGEDPWRSGPINNAHLNSVDTYYRLVPFFQQRLTAAGGDMKRFFREVKSYRDPGP